MSYVRVLAGHQARLTPRFRGVTSYSVRVLKNKSRDVVRISPETESTFRKISDPANAHLFTAEAALQAFGDVQS